MKIPSYLQRNRYGIFHFRRAVPLHLRDVIGKRELIRSLKTREPREAVQLGRLFAIQAEQWLQEACMCKDKTIKTGWTNEYTLPDGTSGKLTTDPNEIIDLKNAGFSTDEIKELIQATPAPQKSHTIKENISNSASGMKLSELIDMFNQHRIDERDGDWLIPSGDKAKLRRLTEIISADTLISSIDANIAELARKELRKLPSNTSKYRNLTVHKIIHVTKDEDIACLSQKTINDHLELYRRLFNYAQNRRLTSINPFDKIRVVKTVKERATRDRNAFTREELKKIFSTPIHTGLKSTRQYYYWAPLIALYSGARRAEIASLYLDDVRKKNEVWVFDFNENSEDKRVKTANGLRDTPIHPHLIDLGLLNYIDKLKKQGETRLFPEVKSWTDKEGYGRPIGDWFTEHLRKLGIYERNKKVFHSFRHTLTTELRRAGADPLTIEQICGRSSGNKTIGESAYTEKDKIKTLHDALAKVDFSEELKDVLSFSI